ncbi:MAG: phospholipase D-like domain-containing protein [Nitrospira sp.]
MSRPTCLTLIAVIVAGNVCFLQPSVCASATIDVYYARKNHPIDRVVSLYAQATRYIFVSVYGLTSAPSVVKALVEAKHRGVDVRVITDRERLNDPEAAERREDLAIGGCAHQNQPA